MLDLVTGGAGFVGRHLVEALRQRNRTVRVLDQQARPGDWPGDIDYIQGSILDADQVANAARGCARVFHLAANPNLWNRDPKSFYRVNTQGTEIVLKACADLAIDRVVYCSTESILKSYRWRKTPTEKGLIDETIRLTVDDMPGPYCRSKFLAEQVALTWAGQGMPIVIVNPTLPIGPGDRLMTPPTRMLLDFVNGKTPAYLESAFNLIDVRDVAVGHILAAEKGRVGQRYILGAHNKTLSDLLLVLEKVSGLAMPRRRVPYAVAFAAALVSEGLSKTTGRPPVAPITGVRLARTPMMFDSAKAVRELGLPQTPLEDSLADFLDWHRRRNELRE